MIQHPPGSHPKSPGSELVKRVTSDGHVFGTGNAPAIGAVVVEPDDGCDDGDVDGAILGKVDGT